MAAREFQFTEGTSRKFWRITLAGKSHTVQFGRIGTSGQAQQKDFADEAQAKSSYDKLVAEKLKKGYVEVGAAGTGNPPATVAVQKKTVAESSVSANGAAPAVAPVPAAPASLVAIAAAPVAAVRVRPVAPRTAPASPEHANGSVPPETLTLDSSHSIDLRPIDWLWATWRPRTPWPRPKPKPFDLDGALARLRAVSGAAYWSALEWGKAHIGVALTTEEAAFWFAAMTSARLAKRTWQDSFDGRALAEDLASGAPDQRLTHNHVFDAMRAVARYLTPEIVKPLAAIFEPVDLVILLKRDEAAVAGAQPGHASSIAHHLVAGFRAYWLPYLAEDELQRLRLRLAPELDLGAWPTNHYQIPPGVLHLAACAGMHDELRALVNSWPVDFYGRVSWDGSHYHRPQEIVFGLGSAREVEVQFRRLRLHLNQTRYIRAWLAHTEHTALDYVAESVLAVANKESAASLARALALVTAPEVAQHMLDLMLNSKAPAVGRDWLDNHPAHAIAGLVPVAAGRGRLAAGAEEYLQKLARRGYRPPIQEALERAEREGVVSVEAAQRLREEVLHAAGADLPPFDDHSTPHWLREALATSTGRARKRVTWVHPADLPAVVAGDRRLNETQTDALLEALATGTLREPHPLVRAVKAHAGEAARDGFAWALFDAWLAGGAPSRENWAMQAIGYLGGDRSVLRLTPLIRAWPGESQHQRAVLGLECLRAIGTDTALMQINGIAQKVQFKGLQARAVECMEGIAQDRGMSRAELEDRIVPDCGLDERGTRTFDFGPRRFRFVLGPEMKPMVRDESGALKPDLPKPGARDDAALAGAAVAEWKLLKKQVAEVAKVQAVRLEQAMVTGRRWTPIEFESLLVRHPLMVHLVRLLVWGAYDSAGALAGTFRVTEDHTYADQHDDSYDLPVASRVGIVHPLHLSENERAAWGELLSDYEVVPPFPQLGRPVYHLEPGEADAKEITRFKEAKLAPAALVFTLEKLGWHRGMPEDGGVFHFHTKPFFGATVTAVVEYEGVPVGYYDGWDDQHIERCYFMKGLLVGGLTWNDYHADRYPQPNKAIALGTVDSVAISEVLKDLDSIAAKAK